MEAGVCEQGPSGICARRRRGLDALQQQAERYSGHRRREPVVLPPTVSKVVLVLVTHKPSTTIVTYTHKLPLFVKYTRNLSLLCEVHTQSIITIVIGWVGNLTALLSCGCVIVIAKQAWSERVMEVAMAGG